VRLSEEEQFGSLLAYEIARQCHERARREVENGISDLTVAVVTLATGRTRGTTSLAASGFAWLGAAAINEGVARAIWAVVVPPEVV
jgi:hypothetical protein